MILTEIKRWTVLVYTMVLVVIWVFMATVILNIAVQLSVEYDNRNIEISLINLIEAKWDLSIKYAKDVNATGSGIVDIISCPEWITMSGSNLRTTGIDTEIRFLNSSILCKATNAHNAQDLDIYFNADYTDLEFAEYSWRQVVLNSSSVSWIFTDSDSTNIDLWSAWYLIWDGYDDDFDSDNYNISSSWSLYYPDNYEDNDADSKLLSYGYIIEDSGLFNVFWNNIKSKAYIRSNQNNINANHAVPWDVSSGYLYLDINKAHKIVLYRINPTVYNESNELIIEELLTWTWQAAGVWYLQDDLSIGTGTTDAYDFNFSSNDYALFVENTSSGALLYQIRWEVASSGSWIYINPLKDDDPILFEYLGWHMLIDDNGRLIWDQFEVFWLK